MNWRWARTRRVITEYCKFCVLIGVVLIFGAAVTFCVARGGW